jgi:uncharacterized protein YutE (UPF0331/DUF86 family)
LVESAARINHEIGKSKSIPPSDDYSSFFALVPDWLDRDIASELAAVAKLRNMLVHQYEDLEARQIYEIAEKSASLWRLYLEAVSRNISEHGPVKSCGPNALPLRGG